MPQRLKQIQFHQIIKKLGQAARFIADAKYEKAQKLILIALRINPQYANALLMYSYCLSQQKKFKDLSEPLKATAFSLNCQYYEANGGDIKKIIGRIRTVCQNVEKDILSLLQSTGKQWLNILDIYLKQRDFNSCVHILRLFQNIRKPFDQYSDQNLSNIGVKFFELGMYKQSIFMHELASQRSPTDVMYYNNLSILNYAIGNYDKSLEYNLKTLELEPNRIKSHYVQSFIFIRMGRLQQGIQKAKFASSKQPQDLLFRIKVLTNTLLIQPENTKQAKKIIEKALYQLKQGTITKQYFVGDDSLQETLSFLQKNLPMYEQKKIDSTDWKKYICMLDQYLLRGLRQKIMLRKAMKQISQKIINQLKIVQQVPQQVNLQKTASN